MQVVRTLDTQSLLTESSLRFIRFLLEFCIRTNQFSSVPAWLSILRHFSTSFRCSKTTELTGKAASSFLTALTSFFRDTARWIKIAMLHANAQSVQQAAESESLIQKKHTATVSALQIWTGRRKWLSLTARTLSTSTNTKTSSLKCASI